MPFSMLDVILMIKWSIWLTMIFLYSLNKNSTKHNLVKKIFSLFILWLLFAMNCASNMSIAGFFEWDNKEMAHTMEMNHQSMDISDCCETMEKDCDGNMHECCISPFVDSNIPLHSIQENKKKTITIDNDRIDLLAILQWIEKEQIFLQRVISPPWWQNNNYIALESTYTEIVGIIKNNC